MRIGTALLTAACFISGIVVFVSHANAQTYARQSDYASGYQASDYRGQSYSPPSYNQQSYSQTGYRQPAYTAPSYDQGYRRASEDVGYGAAYQGGYDDDVGFTPRYNARPVSQPLYSYPGRPVVQRPAPTCHENTYRQDW